MRVLRVFGPGRPLRVAAMVTAVSGLAAVAGVAGCSSAGSGGSPKPLAIVHTPADRSGYEGAALSRPYRVPAVTLTDTEHQQFNLVRSTTKPVTLLYFGYTNCPDICSLVMASIASAVNRLDPNVRDRVQVVFVTTDPRRDSAAVLRSYLDRFNPSFEGLTGPLRTIKRAADALGVPIEGTKRLPGGGYEVGHGTQVIGVGADDRAPVVWTEGTSVSAMVHDITLLVRRQ